MFTRLRAARDGQPLNAEKYTRLFVGGRLWMTDAEFECATNWRFVQTAKGDVLIAGLGLSVIQADARNWKVPKKAYDTIYLDIWADVPNSDNKAEIAALKRQYRPALKTGGKVSAWCEEYTR